MDDLRYPTGRFTPAPSLTPDLIARDIVTLRTTPDALRQAVAGLSDTQLDTPYRPGGWTVRQVVHHVPDSHLNAYIRTKLALTEDNPTIKPYREDAWATLADTATVPIDVSVSLLDAVHARWIAILESMTPADFDRPLEHPERGRVTIGWLLQLYAWHGPHHIAHVTRLRSREGW